MQPHTVFVRRDGEVRAGWRIAFFVVATLAAGMLVAAVAYPLLSLTPLVGLAREWRIPLDEVGSLVALLAATAVTLHVVEGGREGGWESVGLHRGALRPGGLAAALAAGTLAILLPALVLLSAGAMRFEPQPHAQSWAGASVTALIVLAPAAFVEELAMRGYLLTTLRDAIRTPAAIVVTSLVFALLHLLNPDPTILSTAMVALAGVFLSVVRLATQSLFAAVVAHLAWNMAQAALLHAPVSGLALPTPGYRLVDQGPAWLTGGAWGPEGGLAAAVGMLLATFVIVRRPRALARASHAEARLGPPGSPVERR